MNNMYEHRGFATYPMKRKRGRPRKYPRPGETFEDNIQMLPSPQPNIAFNNTVNDESIGQLVHGFIDGSFDAGYLLTVKVANTDTTLKGAVFKPGKCVPLSAENDIAPNVPMIHRVEIPFPSEVPFTAQENGASNEEHPTEAAISEAPYQVTPKQIEAERMASEEVKEEPKEELSIQMKAEGIASEGPCKDAAIQIQIRDENNSESANFDSLLIEAAVVGDEKIVDLENKGAEKQEGSSGGHFAV